MDASITWQIVLILFLGGFCAAFIDSTVGGGGLISVPVLMSLGLPPHIVLGTNKAAASMGAVSSVFSFWKAGKIKFKNISLLIFLSFMFSAAGAFAVTLLDESFMKQIAVFLLIIAAIYTF